MCPRVRGRSTCLDAKHVQLARDRDTDPRDVADAIDDVGDELLRLVFTARHPVLPQRLTNLTAHVHGHDSGFLRVQWTEACRLISAHLRVCRCHTFDCLRASETVSRIGVA